MPKIGELLAAGRTLSHEFFPPATDDAERQLEKTLQSLAKTNPSFVSVTCGAGGAPQDRTHAVVSHIHEDTELTVMPHLTCVGHSRDTVLELLGQYKTEGIDNVLALAGDPPKDPNAPKGDFTYATELIALAREVGEFSVGVAVFPEVHPRSASREADRRHLAAKLEQADFGITQFFFEPEPYLQMRDELDALGCTTPVLPGVQAVIANVARIRQITAMNGATWPQWLSERLDKATTVAESVAIGVEVAIELSGRLLAEGAPGLHLYGLNRSQPVRQVVKAVWS